GVHVRRQPLALGRRLGRDIVGERGAAHLGAVQPGIAALVDVHHSDFVIVVRVVGVVAEAVMLLLGVVQHQAELHALAGELAIGQASQAGQHLGQALLGAVGQQLLAGGAVGRPVPLHLLEVGDQQLGGDREIGGAAVAIAAGAVGDL